MDTNHQTPDPIATHPELMASIAAVQHATEKAVGDLEAAHAKLHAEYVRLGERNQQLWAMPIQRGAMLALLLDAVDEHGRSFARDSRLEALFGAFVHPSGDRPNAPKGGALSGSRGYRAGPISTCDVVALRAGAGSQLAKLERMLLSEREQAGGTLPMDTLPGRSGHIHRPPAPAAFLEVREGAAGIAGALAFFCNSQVKDTMRRAFDRAVPADWPAKPDDATPADWNSTTEQRMREIEANEAARVALLARMRALDGEILQVARGQDLGKRAMGRTITEDFAY